jgi:hypothetical protein
MAHQLDNKVGKGVCGYVSLQAVPDLGACGTFLPIMALIFLVRVKQSELLVDETTWYHADTLSYEAMPVGRLKRFKANN